MKILIHEGNEPYYERLVNEKLAELGVKPYVYHVRSYGNGSQRKVIRGFNAITIVDLKPHKISEIESDVAKAIDSLANSRMLYGAEIHPATWMLEYLRDHGYHGIAICDRRDNFSRKRGRIIAKGRLLKYLKSTGKYPLELSTTDLRVVAKGG